jgi:hypothetical protein
MTGHELLKEAGALVSLLEAPEGADADTFDSLLATWLDSTDDKITAYWAVLRRMSDEADQLRDLESALQRRRHYIDRQAERVKVLATELLAAREALGEAAKVKTPLFSAWLATTRSVEVSVAPEELESCYQRVVVSVDKRALMRDLEVGKEVAGANIVENRGVRWR